MNTDIWNDRDEYEASALEDRHLMVTPTYTSNLSQTPDHLGLKTIKVTGDVVVTTGGIQLVCAACDAPFTIDQWIMRSWRQNGDLYHEECDGAYRTGRGVSMETYRKKPVAVEAVQWNGSVGSATTIIDWILSHGGTARYDDNQPYLHSPHCRCDGRGIVPGKNQAMPCPATEPTGGGPPTLSIDTLEGTMKASVGDYIIRGVQGEFYPCKPDIFEATYDGPSPKVSDR